MKWKQVMWVIQFIYNYGNEVSPENAELMS
jgi:hypothetical protein